jgi:brefeldin A-resistance guanine nucleotide exchange factor 1
MARTDLPPPTLLLQEIQSLTSSMRRNQRWASTSSSSFASSAAPLPPSLAAKAGSSGLRNKRAREVEEGDLMEGFVELKRSLLGVKGEPTVALTCCD